MNIGYRDMNEDRPPDTLPWRLQSSPEGRQLSVDGSLVLAVSPDDPNTSTDIPPDGRVVIYDRAGTLELWAFTRDTGWQQIT